MAKKIYDWKDKCHGHLKTFSVKDGICGDCGKKTITEDCEKQFLQLWHTYHAKYKIPYSHDEARDMFVKMSLIFWEGGFGDVAAMRGASKLIDEQDKRIEGLESENAVLREQNMAGILRVRELEVIVDRAGDVTMLWKTGEMTSEKAEEVSRWLLTGRESV